MSEIGEVGIQGIFLNSGLQNSSLLLFFTDRRFSVTLDCVLFISLDFRDNQVSKFIVF